MEKSKKKEMRNKISERLDVTKTRLSDDDAIFLNDFLDNYEDKYQGKTNTETTSYTGWSSDGKYTRTTTTVTRFLDDPGIEITESYQDDDGQSGESHRHIQDARGILNWFKGKN